MGLLQPTQETLRQMSNYAAGQNIQNQNPAIPRPGQPTSYQIAPTGITGNFSPEVAQYINQDINGFNSPSVGFGSEWNSLNGRLLGDTYLPPDVSTVDVGKGWYEVHHGGQRVGTLRPGGPNGRFLNDTNWQMPQPGLVTGPPAVGGQPGALPPQSQAFNSNGRYGAQAMQMAGLLAQPPQPQPPQPQPAVGGGLLGGPKRGFLGPGGK